MKWKRVYPCDEEHPETHIPCERHVDDPDSGWHPGTHWYTVWVDGDPSYPVFWNTEES